MYVGYGLLCVKVPQYLRPGITFVNLRSPIHINFCLMKKKIIVTNTLIHINNRLILVIKNLDPLKSGF